MLRIHAQLRWKTTPMGHVGKNWPREKFSRRCFHNPAWVRALTTCAGPSYSPYWTSKEELGQLSTSRPVSDRCSVHACECEPTPTYPWLPPPTSGAKSQAVTLKRGAPRKNGSHRPNAVVIQAVYVICLNVSRCLPNAQLQALRNGMPSGCVVRKVAASQPNISTSPLLSAGEMGVRDSMLRVFRDAVGSPGTILVLEEDALLALDFSARLSTALACPRCGCQLVPGSGATNFPPSLPPLPPYFSLSFQAQMPQTYPLSLRLPVGRCVFTILAFTRLFYFSSLPRSLSHTSAVPF